MGPAERYGMKLFFKRTICFLLLLSVLPILVLAALYQSGEIRPFSAFIHELSEDQLFGLAYDNYDKAYKFHMTDEVARPQVLVLGSSRIMQVKRSVVSPAYSFYNAGGAIRNAYELPLFIGKLHGQPELIILNIDQYWFNPNFDDERAAFSSSVYDAPKLNPRQFGYKVWLFAVDLLKGKIDLARLLTSKNIGLNAICSENGFAADGTRYPGNMIKEPERQEDYNFQNVLDRIHDGDRRFQYCSDADDTVAEGIDSFLSTCAGRGIKVVAVMPPFAPKVYQKMVETGHYTYLSELYGLLAPVFARYKGCEIFDFTDVTSLGVHNYDFIDGFHGSERIYNQMIREIVNRDSTVASYFVPLSEIDRLDSVYASRHIRYHSID